MKVPVGTTAALQRTISINAHRALGTRNTGYGSRGRSLGKIEVEYRTLLRFAFHCMNLSATRFANLVRVSTLSHTRSSLARSLPLTHTYP